VGGNEYYFKNVQTGGEAKMNRKWGLIAVSTIVLIVVCSFLFQWGNASEPIDNPPLDEITYTMSGEGSQWEVTNYRIYRSEDQIVRGSAKLHYLGVIQDIQESRYLKFRIVEIQPGVGATTVLSSSYEGENTIINMEKRMEDLGQISSTPTENELSMEAEDFETTRFEIEWKDSQGNLHNESFDLSITQ